MKITIAIKHFYQMRRIKVGTSHYWVHISTADADTMLVASDYIIFADKGGEINIVINDTDTLDLSLKPKYGRYILPVRSDEVTEQIHDTPCVQCTYVNLFNMLVLAHARRSCDTTSAHGTFGHGNWENDSRTDWQGWGPIIYCTI